MKTIKLLGLSLILSLAACTAGAPQGSEENLQGTGWELVSMGAEKNATPAHPNAPVTLEFGADGRAGGHGGCNSYGGEYRVQDGKLVFEQMASTLKACAEPEVTEQERQYLQALSDAGRFAVEKNTLKIWYDDGKSLLKFKRKAASSANASEQAEFTVQ